MNKSPNNVALWRDLELWVRSKSLKVIENGTIEKLGYGFIFVFHSNYGRISSSFDTIHERDRNPYSQTPRLARQTSHDGIGRAYA